MKRFMKWFAAAVLPVAIALSIAPSAQAQESDCATHVLDATAARGISTDQIERQIGMLQESYPGANVYVRAYEQMPGGSSEVFLSQALAECPSWRSESGDRLADNTMIVVYGHDVDQISVLYGYHFRSVISYRDHEYMINGISAGIGPTKSFVDPNYTTSAIVDALRATQSHVVGYNRDLAKLYGKEVKAYAPAPYVDPNSFAEESDPKDVAGVAALVVVSFLAFGLVATGLARAYRYLSRQPAEVE
jgi:hypothetical protein